MSSALAPVVLGLAGGYTWGMGASHYSTKIGGRPCFPGRQPPAQAAEKDVTCTECGLGLSLVMQVKMISSCMQCFMFLQLIPLHFTHGND